VGTGIGFVHDGACGVARSVLGLGLLQVCLSIMEWLDRSWMAGEMMMAGKRWW